MGLITSMNNAVSGLRVNQDSLATVSRNVANSGTPGYHRQSINIVDYNNNAGTYARTSGLDRTFNASLQAYYNRQVSDTSTASVQAGYLDRLQTFLGKPGQSGSLDTIFGELQNALQGIATSPDDYPSRAQAVSSAQAMAETLNRLSGSVQQMRQETETQIANDVKNLNGMLTSLGEVNNRMHDVGMTDASKAALADQRDRLVSSIAEMVDVRADYQADGTVSLMTRSGIGLIDRSGVGSFSFEAAGTLTPNTTYSRDPNANRVGSLTLVSPAGNRIDMMSPGLLQGGEIAGLITLRDKTLVEAQGQLDEIAAGLAQAFSTNTTAGTAATNGAQTGFDLDLSGMASGNDFLFSYSENGVEKRVRVVNTTTPQDSVDSSGQRVIGIDMSNGAGDVATALQASFPNLNFSGTGNTLSILDDGAGNVTDVKSASVRKTSTALQGDGLGLNLFVDQGNTAFTNNLDTDPPQKQGFAARISINPAVVANNQLIVQSQAGATLGNADRANHVINQLNTMSFASGGGTTGQFAINGNLNSVISQVINYQGTSANQAIARMDDRQMALDTLTDQMDSEYGVNVDEEMARLMELQNAYAANARVMTVVKELLDTLFAATN